MRRHLAERFQADRRGICTGCGSSRFRTTPLRQPDRLRFLTSRGSPALCQLRPERYGGRRNSFAVNDGRTACPAKRGVTPADTGERRPLKRPAPPQRPLPNGRDKALPRPCDDWSGWLRRRRHGQRYVVGRGSVSARGGRLRAADRVGRGPDQRTGGAMINRTGQQRDNRPPQVLSPTATSRKWPH